MLWTDVQLAANGRSLLDKIRFVAVTLLDSSPAGDVFGEGSDATLLKFLRILSEIEAVRSFRFQRFVPGLT
jgi:hypothetical protein